MSQTIERTSVNPMTVVQAMIAALGHMAITIANKSDVFVEKLGNNLINTASAGEHMTKALDSRAAIYGAAVVSTGELAKREHEIKQRIRLFALEREEAELTAKQVPVKPQQQNNKSTKPSIVDGIEVLN